MTLLLEQEMTDVMTDVTTDVTTDTEDASGKQRVNHLDKTRDG
jgi:hypothetical protein